MDQKYHKRVIIVTVNCALVVHPSETCAFCTSLASRTPRNGEKISFKFATLQPVSRSLGANGRPRSLSQGGRQSGGRRKSPGYSHVRCFLAFGYTAVHIIHELLREVHLGSQTLWAHLRVLILSKFISNLRTLRFTTF